jgi:hypothetical protein
MHYERAGACDFMDSACHDEDDISIDDDFYDK